MRLCTFMLIITIKDTFLRGNRMIINIKIQGGVIVGALVTWAIYTQGQLLL